MNKSKLKTIIIFILILLLVVFSIYLIINKNKKQEFYVKVKESFNNSSIVEPLNNEKIFKKYPLLEINVGDLSEGDVIRITTNEDIIETYPPVVNVKSYEHIINNKPSNENSTKTTTTTAPTTTTTNKTSLTTKITTTTKITKLENKDNTVLNLLENEIKSIENNEKNKSFGTTAKEYFTSIIDFIFYDKDIKGVYFKDLTNTAKLKVISLALKLDSLIDKHYPEYKEKLSSSYQNVKTKLIELYLEKTSDYCASHDEVCEQAKYDFAELKRDYGITWELIKKIGNKGLTKLKEWYEIYSGK